ncbi:MAG: DivIVA domain-containing protein [Clostridia bacterium]|nr:DivIVA domain-containing protein [Clostridia bacterium]
MMTPAQLKAYEFKTAGRNAYKAEDVDMFLSEVVISYEKMFRENSELIKRVSMLADRLEQYKSDEVDIKQAVLSAQKAANLIVKEAEDSVADAKTEAEAILAAAKGEAEIIKSDAEKQAIADSELLLSVTKDKAEEIIAKAKEKAQGILIAANDSASDTMGAANRTVTSESLYYDMLKKEVSEFKTSILAQYKEHIELISKLPELAAEEAAKIENEELPQVKVEELSVEEEETPVVFEESSEDVLEYVNTVEEEFDEEIEGETVIKTELPYDFFSEDTSLEFVEEEAEVENTAVSVDVFGASEEIEDSVQDIPVSKKITVDANRAEEASEVVSITEMVEGFEESVAEEQEETFEEAVPSNIVEETSEEEEDDDFGYEEDDDSSSFFDLFEKIDTKSDGGDDDTKPKRRGLFRRKK